MPDRSPDVDVLLPATLELGEGPVWDDRAGALWFVDILDGAVHRFDPGLGTHDAWRCDRLIGALALTDVLAGEDAAAGRALLATERGFERWRLGEPAPTEICTVDAADPDIRMNDGKVAPDGSFWAGTMSMRGDERRGALHRLDGDGGVERLIDGLTLSNGLGWSPDGAWFYLIDSPCRTVTRYRIDDRGRPIEPTVLVDTSPFDGLPDGLTVDADGCLWVCFWGGGVVRRFDADGAHVADHPVPVANPTSCTFGGAALDRLFVTTARFGLSTDELDDQPLAGSVLELAPGAVGLPATRWEDRRAVERADERG